MKLLFTSLVAFVFIQVNFAQYSQDFQAIIDNYTITNNVQGISASIQLKDGDNWQGVAGFSHEDVPMDTSMLMGIASNTKLFTSIICLKMIEAGRFTLQDKVGDWLNPIQFVDPNTTVLQLLQHNSGINDFINNSDIYPTQILENPTKIWTPLETLSYIFEPITSPGEGVYYSNANYILAAMILEKATGMQYLDLVRDSLIEPLGLEVFFEGFEEIEGTIAHPFLFGGDYSAIPRIALGTTTWSAGCMVAKPMMLTKWYDAIFNGQFVSEIIKSQLLSFILWPDDPEGKEMGLGIYSISEEGRSYYGHGGRTIGYSSYTLYDKECGHSISVVANEFFSDAYTLAIELAEKACDLTSGTSSELEDKSQIKIYPNPADRYFIITGATNYALFDVAGKLIKSGSSSNQISVVDLQSGVYFIRLKVQGESFVKKIIIKH